MSASQMHLTFKKSFRRDAAGFRCAFLLVAGIILSISGGAMADEPLLPVPGKIKSEWHTIAMPGRTNPPAIHFYDKLNPIWWFGNVDQPTAPDWYRPGEKDRDFLWHLRNPLTNFSNYVIGVGDKDTVRSGYYPDRTSNPYGGWLFAVTRRKIVYLPFVDYKRGGFEFYFGWRLHGNFGIKLNFNQAPKRGPGKPLDTMPEIKPQIVVNI